MEDIYKRGTILIRVTGLPETKKEKALKKTKEPKEKEALIEEAKREEEK